jgi:hypothetical protein
MNEEFEENNDDENEEEGNNILASIFRGLKGKEKWYCKKKNVPKPNYQLAKNVLAKNIGEKVNAGIDNSNEYIQGLFNKANNAEGFLYPIYTVLGGQKTGIADVVNSLSTGDGNIKGSVSGVNGNTSYIKGISDQVSSIKEAVGKINTSVTVNTSTPTSSSSTSSAPVSTPAPAPAQPQVDPHSARANGAWVNTVFDTIQRYATVGNQHKDFTTQATNSINRILYGKTGMTMGNNQNKIKQALNDAGVNYDDFAIELNNRIVANSKDFKTGKFSITHFASGGLVDNIKNSISGSGDDTVTINTLKKGEAVFDVDTTKILLDFNNKAPILKNIMDSQNTGNTNNVDSVTFNVSLPNVNDYKSFKNELIADKNFNKAIVTVVDNALTGSNSLRKHKYR